MKWPVDLVGFLEAETIAQVIEPRLLHRDVGDVAAVGPLPLLRGHPLLDAGGGQPQPLVDRPHPGGVAPGQIVVVGEHVHALTGEGVERHRCHGRQGLALAGLHLHQLALVHGHARQELHLIRPFAERSPGRLAHQGEAFREERVERLTAQGPLSQGLRPLAQLPVGER